MSVKPFNLEEAKAGKPFAPKDGGSGAVIRCFIGVRTNGSIVYEHGNSLLLAVVNPDALCMIPTTKKIKVYLYKSSAGVVWASTTDHRGSLSNSAFLTETEIEYEAY